MASGSQAFRTRRHASLVLATTLVAGSSAVSARPASTGWFAEGGIGGAGYLGDASAAATIGPTFSLAAGLDLTPWFSLGLRDTVVVIVPA